VLKRLKYNKALAVRSVAVPSQRRQRQGMCCIVGKVESALGRDVFLAGVLEPIWSGASTFSTPALTRLSKASEFIFVSKYE
jgi:hypothetical protein